MELKDIIKAFAQSTTQGYLPLAEWFVNKEEEFFDAEWYPKYDISACETEEEVKAFVEEWLEDLDYLFYECSKENDTDFTYYYKIVDWNGCGMTSAMDAFLINYFKLKLNITK